MAEVAPDAIAQVLRATGGRRKAFASAGRIAGDCAGKAVARSTGMAFQKIMCPVDFSPGSQQAMRVAVRLANERDAELVLVHAWHLPSIAVAGEYTYSTEVSQHLAKDAEQSLAAAVLEAEKASVRRVRSKLLIGQAWQRIVETAQSEPFDMIVVGTHGRTGIARVLLGSVSELVVRHAPCPVLTVRPDGEPRPFAHVLCPVDFSASSRDAMKLAAEVIQPGGHITLLHVLELPQPYLGELRVPGFYRELSARSATLFEQWTNELTQSTTAQVTARTVIGRPGAQLLAVLDDDRSIDLVVMGSHGRTGLARMAFGSVAEKTVRNAPCAVLVARGGGVA